MAEEQALVQLMDTLDGLELTKSEYEWLEQRFAAMTEKEQLLFRGAMKLEKPETASEAIDIAGQLHCYDLCKAGLLQKDPRWRENGSYTSNLYRLL